MTKLQLLEELSAFGILSHDLRLFLDVNPTNRAAMADFKRVTAEYKDLIALYEQNFGPLTGGNDVDGTWTFGPWPWQRDIGGNA